MPSYDPQQQYSSGQRLGGRQPSMPVEQPTPGARRSRGLADIAPQYVAKSGLCTASDMESSRGGSIRIHHLTATSGAPQEGRSRFPKLDECAHFHYEQVELGPFQATLHDEELKPLAYEDTENKYWLVSVTSQGKSWILRRTYENFRMLDQQLHRCIYDRKFSGLKELPPEDNIPGENSETNIKHLLTEYLSQFSQIAGNLINCGPVLNWLELDNRGRRLLVPDGDNCPINTPAVAAAYAVKRYTAQAGDEISFEVGDMISVIDMPPPEESVWWHGKRGFQVGFFPCECVAVIGDKVPRNLPVPGHLTQHSTPEQPSKPVLRKHGKLIAFFRSFILSRPSRRRLKQSGILKERVFGCDLGEHLLNSGHEIPMVLKCCAEFIESHGIVDGIYRLSGVTSNIQKLRNAFDEDRVPALYEDEAILQDIHSVASLLKMYFRELPNPLCTYQLYHTFVSAVQSTQEESYRLLRMRDAVQKLPPPHYRTLEYLMRHLARVAERGNTTGMTPRNVAIVWAPNLLRCKELEVGGVAALQGVGVQAVVTEFLVCYTDLIFSDGIPPLTNIPPPQTTPKRSRPKSLAISTPTKLLSLEEARTRAFLSAGKENQEYIEVGGGPANLPAKYHTVIELPGSGRKRSGSSSKRSPLGWKAFFSKSGRKSSAPPQRKASTPSELGLNQLEKAVTETELAQGRRRLRPVKSAESLASGANSCRNSAALDLESEQNSEKTSDRDPLSPGPASVKSAGHSRSVSHDSYFDHLAETPVHPSRPSQLTEEAEDHFSSSLDLSEIQLNFDLEESEMRIFSEDETLVSTSVGSGSIMSQASPRMGTAFRVRQIMTSSKRVPVPRARPEDPLSGCPSADPSPKKQKTSAAQVSPQGSTRSKRSRLEEQLACSASDLRFIDSQSPENQQLLLVQAEVHPHHAYVNIPDLKSCSSSPPGITAESPPNTMNSMSALSITSPSIADATVSDNESLTIHSSGLPTPDTPLFVYTPLRDDETYSSSNNNTPDYQKMMQSPGSPEFGTYHRLGDPSLSPSPIPTPCLTTRNPYENVLAQDTINNLPGYENVVSRYDASENADNGESTEEETHTVEDSLVTNAYENEESVVYEQLVSELEEVPGYEPVGYEPIPDGEHCEGSGCESRRLYENVENSPGEEEHLYEVVQFPGSEPDLCPPQEPLVELKDTPLINDKEVYQQVKYFRNSVHEVNELLDESQTDELKESSNEQESATCAMQESSTPNNEVLCEPQNEFMEPNVCGGESVVESEVEGLTERESSQCSDPGGGFCKSVIEPVDSERSVLIEDVLVQLRHRKRQNSNNRSESDSSPARGSSESPHSSPEHRRSSGLDSESNRRRFESEIGRDIVRERRMKQELEEMRIANQGCDTMIQRPPKTASKCNVRELLSKFETSPTTTPDEPQFPAVPSSDKFGYSNHDSHETCDTTNLARKADSSDTKSQFSCTPILSLPGKDPSYSAVTPKLSRRSDTNSPANSTTSLPPCVRARLAKAARNKLANSTVLSVSLDEGHFLTSSGKDSGQLVRVQTSPDINDARENREISTDSSLKKNKSASELSGTVMEKPLALAATDLDDPQRRERIERYKEERRLFLREKYRSESFRGDRDEILQRLKQKAGKTLSSPTSDEMMDLSRSVTGTERVRSNSFRSTSDERERDIMTKSEKNLSGTLERVRTKRFSTKDQDEENTSSPEHGSIYLDRKPKKFSEDSENSRYHRVSSSDKQKFNGTSSSPEKSPVTCVTVRQRLGSDRMVVSVGPTCTDRSPMKARNQFEEYSKPCVLKSVTGQVSVSEAKRHFSSIELEPAVELRKTPFASERLTKSYDGSLRKRSTEKAEQPEVEIRLSSSRGILGDSRPTSIPIRSPERSLDSVRRKSTTDCSGRQTSPAYCIKDMAAIFENRKDPRSQPPSRPTPAGKQYLSSV